MLLLLFLSLHAQWPAACFTGPSFYALWPGASEHVLPLKLEIVLRANDHLTYAFHNGLDSQCIGELVLFMPNFLGA